MKHELRLTDIGEGLEEAEIIEWLVAVGDVVTRDQAVIEIMTDKSNAELPAPSAGRIVELSGVVGDMIHVGDMIAIIDDGASDDTPASVPTTPPAVAAPPTPAPPTPAAASATPVVRPKASPSTRREAARRGIDLTTVAPSGPGGRILLSDLDNPGPGAAATTATSPPPQPAVAAPPVMQPSHQAAAPTRTPRPAPAASAGTVPLRGMRRLVAQNMAQSWSDIPHIHASNQIDAHALLATRKAIRGSGHDELASITPLTFFVAAVASALRSFPQANASIDMSAETITTHADVNVGIAVAAPQGLIVPVIDRADQRGLRGIAAEVSRLVASAREGSIDRSDLTGGTATITNFGSLGGEQATPLIRPPEAVIFGFGSVADRPFVVDGVVVARPTMHVVVGADHRLLDGDVTTQLLNHVCGLLADPVRLLLDT